MIKTFFATPQDAEIAFYEAFEQKDLSAMMAVWAEDEEIVCIHAGGERLSGFDKVRAGWSLIFSSPEPMRIELSNQIYTQNTLLAAHSVHENFVFGGENKTRPPLLATNVYIRSVGGWRMLLHHASTAIMRKAEPARDENKRLH